MDLEKLILNDKGEYTKNITIIDSFTKAYSVINNPKYNRILVSISGGADSDIMMDLIHRVDIDKKCIYVFFDTGIEYNPTYEHLDYLNERYGIRCWKKKANIPVPLGIKKYGYPFLSKDVSKEIEMLQKYDFDFSDRPYDELVKEYPKIKSAIAWWCNAKSGVRYNIKEYKWLKEYMIENPPSFKISPKCCEGAKKNMAKKLLMDLDPNFCFQLNVVGVRKAEGGARTRIKSCYKVSDYKYGYDTYYPLLWYSNEDKKEYEKIYGIVHSDCYTKWGFNRTGCACCPFGGKFEKELEVLKENDRKLYNAVVNVFDKSYEYTRGYREFRRKMDGK